MAILGIVASSAFVFTISSMGVLFFGTMAYGIMKGLD